MSAPQAESIDHDSDFDRRLVSCLILSPAELIGVARIVTPRDLGDLRARVVFEALQAAGGEIVNRDGGIDLLLLIRTLKDLGNLDVAGGPGGVNEMADLEASASFAMQYAKRIKQDAISREIRRHCREVDSHPDDVEAFESLRERFDEFRKLKFDEALQGGIGLTGSELAALADEPDPVSPLPGYFDPEPSLHVVHGVAKTGKTTLAWNIGIAWANGRAPWERAPSLPGSRVLILSGEQGTRKCLRVLRRVARTAELGRFDEWRDRVTVVGRHPEMSDIDRRLLCLDAEGIAALEWALKDARENGDPYGLILADSLSRLKPEGAEENNNDHMVALLKPLAALCTELDAYCLMIHHAGHNADRRGKPVEGARGASAIREVPQALWAISRVPDEPRNRLVRVAGNELGDLTQVFEVANALEDEGHINRFFPSMDRALDLEEIFAEGPLSSTEFGRRALGWAPGKAPSGGGKKKAQKTLEDLEKKGLIRREGTGWDINR